VRGDERAGDGQADPGAAVGLVASGVGAVEPFEYVRQVLGAMPSSVPVTVIWTSRPTGCAVTGTPTFTACGFGLALTLWSGYWYLDRRFTRRGLPHRRLGASAGYIAPAASASCTPLT